MERKPRKKVKNRFAFVSSNKKNEICEFQSALLFAITSCFKKYNSFAVAKYGDRILKQIIFRKWLSGLLLSAVPLNILHVFFDHRS